MMSYMNLWEICMSARVMETLTPSTARSQSVLAMEWSGEMKQYVSLNERELQVG